MAEARGPWVQCQCTGLQREIHLKNKHTHTTKTKEKPNEPSLFILAFKWSLVFEIAKSCSHTHLLVFSFDAFSWIECTFLILPNSRTFAHVYVCSQNKHLIFFCHQLSVHIFHSESYNAYLLNVINEFFQLFYEIVGYFLIDMKRIDPEL